MSHRSIEPIEINGFVPGGTPRAEPIFEWVEPGTLLVDEGYQRESSERSMKLVRKIVAGFDWSKFKPPVAVLTDAGLELIDGQHTAIAAATHPEISKIPVMIVEVPKREERADAFIGQNTNKVAVTVPQLHVAAVAAGHQAALLVDQVCTAAGARILRTQPGAGRYRAGDTVSVTAIGALIRAHGKPTAIEVMRCLVNAELAPITQVQIKAADMLLTDPEYRGQIALETLTSVIRTMGRKAVDEAAVFRAAHPSTPMWKALGIIWFKNRRSSGKAQVIEKPAGVAGDQPKNGPTGGRLNFQPTDNHSLIKTLSPEIQKRAAIVNDLRLSGHKGEITEPMLTGKKDNRPKLSGWIPGVFLLRCSGCDEKYQGDRKSRSCADCAYGCREAVRA